MILIPIGQEQNTVRRQPWVTFSVMILCALAFLATHFTTQSRAERSAKLFGEAAEYYLEHPYLELDPRLEEALQLPWDEGGDGAQAWEQLARSRGAGAPEAPELRAVEQRELDRLTASAFALMEDTPLRRWGLIPTRLRPASFVTHLFLHAGWMHLLGNMLLLYLIGPFVEDVWGRPLYGAFYVAAGIFSGLLFALHYPQFDGPLIGASGAIAGVMGAFLVRHARRKIVFFYAITFLIRGTFRAPAWAMLPLWVLGELFSARAMDAAVAQGAAGGGVAYWAHVWGFAFGMAAAAAVYLLKIEARYVAPALDAKETVVDNRGLLRALAARDQGRPEDAWRLLLREAKAHPDNLDVAHSLWELAGDLGRRGEAAPVFARALREEIRQGEAFLAFGHWREWSESGVAAGLAPALEVKLAELLAGENAAAEASEVAESLLTRVGSEAPAAVLVRLTRLGRPESRRRAAALALSRPDLPPELRPELQAVVGKEGAPSPEPTRRARSGLKATLAVPLGLRDERLVVQLEGRDPATLAMAKIRAVAAARVGVPGGEPRLVADLLLDTPSPEGRSVRSLRLEDGRFDPRALVPSMDEPVAAFRALVAELASGAGASVLIGGEALRGGPFASYDSVEAYERDLLERGRAG